jgi:hypothetical protein
MRNELTKPFESIESALEFMTILETVVSEASNELQQKADRISGDRHRDGLYLALFKIGQLRSHVQKSRRILNDLTIIRNLLTGYEALRPIASAARASE